MDSSPKKQDLYAHAGIKDLAEFYAARYASGELLHPDYFHALERFHIRWARTMWVYDNVRPGSTVLDLGCGAGLLALLKRKHIRLAGLDLARDCADAALRNGYDLVCVGDLSTLPFRDECFDYVISLDVMGHIEFERKDKVIAEIHRVLKRDGITMHGIETMNAQRRKDYDQMSDEELRHFVQIDGHVGMEPEPDIRERFSRCFSHVQTAWRFSICQSAEELVKQADEYGVALCDRDLIDYLRNLSHNERRAFNMAMGYVFQEISNHGIELPASEYVFLKASAAPLGRFYNEHADRQDLFASFGNERSQPTRSLNESTNALFDGGWYPAERFPHIGRWMGRRATFRFSTRPKSRLLFDLVTHIPDVAQRPLKVDICVNDTPAISLRLSDNEIRAIELELDDFVGLSEGANIDYVVEIRADRTWQPRPDGSDDRELSVALSNIRQVAD